MKFRRRAHNLVRRDVFKAFSTTMSPPERDHRRFSLSWSKSPRREGPTGVAVAAATLGCAGVRHARLLASWGRSERPAWTPTGARAHASHDACLRHG